MLKFINVISLVLLSTFIFSCNQGNQKLEFDKDSPEGLIQFIPEGFSLMDTVKGDLNQDGVNDLIMILDQVDSTSDNDDVRRVILLTTQKNSYQKSSENDHLIYCKTCGGETGDPFQKISYQNGQIIIEHFGGDRLKWARTLTFTYNSTAKDWFLTEDALVSSSADNPEKIDTKILTPKEFGQITFSQFNIYDE